MRTETKTTLHLIDTSLIFSDPSASLPNFCEKTLNSVNVSNRNIENDFCHTVTSRYLKPRYHKVVSKISNIVRTHILFSYTT